MTTRQGYGIHHAVFGWLNFALATPSIYLLLGLPLVMRQQGWSGTEIGIFQLVGLPAVFKFVLAVPVERFRLKGSGYKAWTIVLCLMLALLLTIIGSREMLASRWALFALALGASLLAIWADIPLNALAIRTLPASQRLRAGSIRSAVLFLGAIAGGGLMLVIHARWGWHAPFWLMAGHLAAGAASLALVREPLQAIESRPATGGTRVLRGYFGQTAAGPWTCLLVCCFPFLGAAWLYLKPLLLDHGLGVTAVAWIAGVGGGAVGAAASLGGGRLTRLLGVAHAAPSFAGFGLLALAALTVTSWAAAGTTALIAAAALVAAATGTTSAMAFGLMMYFARPQFQAADYSIQASLFTLSRLAVPMLAGVLLDRFGYPGMLLALTVAMLGVLALAMASRHAIAAAAQEAREITPKAAY